MKNIAYITNSNRYSGVGCRAYEIRTRITHIAYPHLRLVPFFMDGVHCEVTRYGKPIGWIGKVPGILNYKSINWLRISRVLLRYLKHKDTLDYKLYHITNQTLSFLSKRLSPVIITVHDIIEVTDPQDSRAGIINRILYSGITRANRVITVSEYTKKELCEHYTVNPSDVVVIYNGVSETYHPIEHFHDSVVRLEMLRTYNLTDKQKIVLFVGSDHQRKNISVALEAFSQLLKSGCDARFIKVGSAGVLNERIRTMEKIDSLGIRENVIFVNECIDNTTLNDFYNLADVFIFPSRLEGFGMPVLEAMAAGTPVITSGATSLLEVVGDGGTYGQKAAIVHDPDDIGGFSQSLRYVLENKSVREKLIRKGRHRAKQFSWDISAQKVIDVYKTLL